MPYAKGPYERLSSLPAPGPSTLPSSRKIDFATKRYVTTTDGGFESMPDVAQRVCLLVAFAVKEPKSITPQNLAATEQSIRAALASMTSGKEPEIEIIAVHAERLRAGTTEQLVEFKDLTKGTPKTVEVP